MKINFEKTQNNKEEVLILVTSEENVRSTKHEAIKYLEKNKNFTGKIGQTFQTIFQNNSIIITGAGKEKEIGELCAQSLGANIVAFANANKFKEVYVDISSGLISKTLEANNFAANLAFGAKLQTYRFNKYFSDKKEGKDSFIESINIQIEDVKKAKEIYKDLDLVADNIAFARDLVSEPANILNPTNYANICKELSNVGLKVTILGEKEMAKLGMNSLLAVGQGSVEESKLVILEWNGLEDKNTKPLAFVGKGVTFDTGGISIKPSQNMEDMKTDMGGSAVVVSLLRLLAQRKAEVNVIGVVGIVENMPSGDAQRPGDVVTSMSGQTIEVINTDAEGRMVLADALHYTNTKFKPEFIIDLATLTGAIIVALADVHAGLFSNNDKLSKELEDSGKKTGETLWRLPVSKEYDKMINSEIADMRNVGSGRGAGSTTAAQFLHRFIGETPWAHLDIAGVAWKGKGNAGASKGASGYGVKLLNELVSQYYEKR